MPGADHNLNLIRARWWTLFANVPRLSSARLRTVPGYPCTRQMGPHTSTCDRILEAGSCSHATAESQLGSRCEGGRRTSGWIGLIPKVHGCDETALHGEHVKNLAVRKNIPLKALDELVHPDAGLASVFLGHGKRFDMRIELTLLSSPIAADLFLSDDLVAVSGPQPA